MCCEPKLRDADGQGNPVYEAIGALRFPIPRNAQLTPFFTKFRSSVAALQKALPDLPVAPASDGRDLAAWQRPDPALGLLDGYQWVASLGGHARRHAAQIDEIADALGA